MGGLKRHGGRSAEYDRLFGYDDWRWRQFDVDLGWNRLGDHLALRRLRHCLPPLDNDLRRYFFQAPAKSTTVQITKSPVPP
jgi:hypothetical protein